MSSMFALISPGEGDRFCEVQEQPFEVTAPLYWMEVSPGVTPDTHDFIGGEFVAKPPPPVRNVNRTQVSGVEEM